MCLQRGPIPKLRWSPKGNNYTIDGASLNACFPVDGEYKIELIEDSAVFGIRVLDSYQPFTIKRTVMVTGQFTSAD